MLHDSSFPNSLRLANWIPWKWRARPMLVSVSAILLLMLFSVGLLLTARQLLGYMDTVLEPAKMLPLAWGSMLVVTLLRVAWRRNFPFQSTAHIGWEENVFGWLGSLSLILLAVGCCYPGYRNADWLIWLPVLVADQFWRQNFFDAGDPRISVGLPAEENELASVEGIPLAQPSTRDEIVQQLYRVSNEQGEEEIYGTLRADFVPGQRTATVHVGFCPPLPYVPEIEAETLPPTAAKLKVVQSLAHGARLDVKLPQVATTEEQIWIDMAARPQSADAESMSA